MRLALLPALALVATTLAGCGFYPPDPIRYRTSTADVSICHKLGSVGLSRTDGQTSTFADVTEILPQLSPDPPGYRGGPGGEVAGPNFAFRLDVMRDAALGLGATDLLLARRIYRDWSYVEGIAYRCRR